MNRSASDALEQACKDFSLASNASVVESSGRAYRSLT
jgi:hypothetical protein